MNGKKIMRFILLLSTLLGFSLSLFVSSAVADFPHNTNSQVPILCTRCHDASKASTYPDWWTDQENHICGQCHNTGGDPSHDVMTHKSGETVRAQCTMCHNPHNQMQSRTWGTQSYLYSSTSDLAGGVTTTQVKKTGANWTSNQWQNMLVMPNVKYPKFIYKILNNTSDTITIDTVGGPPDNTINTAYCKSGSTFAIVWGKLVKENINGMNVKFFRETGPNSFADDDAAIDGVCQVCHTETKYFKNNGTTAHPGGVSATSCLPCHKHNVGFKMNCTECHGFPPLTSVPTGSDGLVNNEGGTGSASPGAHSKHAVSLAYVCDTCHAGGMPANMPPAPYYDKKIQIGFNIANGAYQSGAYDGRTSLANGYTYSTGNPGTTITTPSTGAMTCSTVYCHTNGTSVSTGIVPVVSSPSWSGGAISSCTACHQFPPAYANGTPKKNAHGSHAYTCNNCHYATTTTGDSITDSSKHANGAYDVIPGLGSSFSYTFASSGGTCSTVSCHSNTGTAWGKSACLDCHSVQLGSRASIKGQFEANSHHVQGVAVIDGRHCYRCHWEANEDGSINPAYHGGSASPGSPVDLVIYGAGARPGAYSAVTATQYTPDGSRLQIGRITTHCLGCHSTQNNGTDPFGDGKTPKQYAWDGTSVELRYAQTGTTTWGKYDPSAYPNVETKYDLTKAYSAHGNASGNQQGWNSSGDTWATMAPATGAINFGCGLAAAGDYIYALAGGTTRNFYRYSISGNTWVSRALTPGIIQYGGALVYAGGDFLYALAGYNTNNFYRYSISGDTWISMAVTPGLVYTGGALVYPGTGDYIYALAGSSTTAFYRYSISGNSWTSMLGTPGLINRGGALTAAGDYIYAFAGNGATAFYRYSISGNSWTSMTSVPATVYEGGALVYPGTGDFIYAFSGANNILFYRYSISGNSWTKMAYAPGAIGWGGALGYSGTGNYIYATGGNYSTAFYRYFMSRWIDTSGAVKVECFDCHNSHGSNAGSDTDDRTTSYSSAAGGVKGGILKDTLLSPSGYSASYKPAFGGSDPNKNSYKAGAALCFDCHMTAAAGTKPWGYQGTFGASQKIMGYWDSEYFSSGTFGSQTRYSYKSGSGNKGGHFGASDTMLTTPAGTINGLCTPCHDPHGVSPTLGSNINYGVPLLKGTWLTSPYKEDVAPASNSQESVNRANAGDVYHIDQNTFGSDVIVGVTGITETDSKFAGLCLQCHPKTSLTATGSPPPANTSLTWKSKDRVHRTVTGWGYPANTKHNYTCSKCHTPHNSRLKRLMVTNCLNTPHKGRMTYNASPVLSGTGWEYCRGGSCYQVYSGSGSGAFPGSGSGGGSGSWGSGSWSRTVTCHEIDSADESWNSRTRW